MSTDEAMPAPQGWRDSLRPYLEPAPLAALFLGISSGFPFAMIGATLTTRLAQDGIEKSSVTAFALTFLAYNLKWAWAPAIDRFRIPILGSIGQRRSWLILVGALVFMAVSVLGNLDPKASLAVVALVVFSARPLAVILRTDAPIADRAEERSVGLSLPVRLTTAFLGVFFGLVCAVVFVPALGWLVMMLGMMIVVIGLAVRNEPWGFANVGYEWRLPQWIAFGFASLVMFLLALLIAATDVVTPGIAAGAGALVAASLIVSALLPGRSRGASAA